MFPLVVPRAALGHSDCRCARKESTSLETVKKNKETVSRKFTPGVSQLLNSNLDRRQSRQ